MLRGDVESIRVGARSNIQDGSVVHVTTRKWKTEIHDVGHSTPVVLGNQVWLTTAKQDGTVLYAVCLDAASGAITHDVAVLNIATPQNINPTNSHATPSPVIEAGRVYVH